MRILIFLAAIIPSLTVNAQDLIYKKYDWERTPGLTTVDMSDTSDKEVVIFEKRVVEFNFDNTGNLFEYYLFHQRTKVLSDDAIEGNNKIYLPLSSSTEVVTLKARTINPDGRIKEMSQKDIIESKEEESGRTFRYFALEGIEKGSEIEQLFLIKRSPNISGTGFNLQSNVKKIKVDFELITPKHLPFKHKSSNGFPELVIDSTVNDRIMYKASYKDMPVLKSEKFASYDPHKMAVVYKLYSNRNTGVSNIFNYAKVAENIYERIYGNYEKDKKLLPKYIKKIGLKPDDSEIEKIHKIEHFIKSNTLILDIQGTNFDDLKTVLSTSITLENKKKKMVASNTGAAKLMAAIFTNLGIDHQIVLTCDRFEEQFDKEFESYHYLNDKLIYFPKHNIYISPSELYSRSSFFSQGLYHTYGLFLVPVSVGSLKSAIGKVKFIEALPETMNTDSLTLSCNLNLSNSKLNINYRRSALGYYAIQYQPFYDLLDKETLEEFEKVFTNFLTSNNEEVKKFSIKNVGAENIGKPMITEAELECEKFVELAGDKYVVKVGELIGPQAEMYQEGKRKLPVENGFNRLYFRRIIFTIPDGYKISDASKLKIQEKHVNEKGAVTMEFISDYKINGNQLTIDCTEYYRQISYPIELFEEFRKVINAAADFNKVGIVLEKIG